jgi:hypothetical protein
MANISNIDDHILFGPSKKLLVYGRDASGILSEADIAYIVDRYVMKNFEAR